LKGANDRVYPRLAELTEGIYDAALAVKVDVHDLRDIFDQTPQPAFIDNVHLNEVGNRLAAERVAPIVAAAIP
jgi:lysophospholipase L1-like esterase